MNIGTVFTNAPERPVRRDVTRPDTRPEARETRRTQQASDADEAREPDEARTERRPVSRDEFSALLAMLAGAGEQVRSDLVKQLPEENASLVDRLLEDAAQGTSTEPPVGQPPMGPPTLTEQEAREGLHYGLLKLPQQNGDVVDLAEYAQGRAQAPGQLDRPSAPSTDARPLDGLARAVSRVSEQASDRSRALEALARVATGRGSSVEQLLAMGDTRGAEARQSLDALLAAAGTPRGARLAAAKLLNDSNSALLGATDNDHALTDAMATLEAVKAKAKSGDVTVASRDLGDVSPELQARVDRVIERMRTEFGHDVQIVETARSQDRQDWLFEQGRTRPGPIVTWTRESAHTRGEAVDVIVDGSWNNPEGFERLQRIAREEGLRTLGMKDPGHLELPNGSGQASGLAFNAAGNTSSSAQRAAETAQATSAAQSSANGTRGMARVAGVAGVAGVARVADSARAARGESLAANGIGQTVRAYATAQPNGRERASGDGASGEGRESRGLALGHAKRESRASEGESGDATAFGGFGGQSSSMPRGQEVAIDAPGRATGSEQAQRVSDIQAMRADAPATPLNRMTLAMDGANGTQEQITIDVRGNTVSTHIRTDADTADALRLRTAELQDALGRQGLEGDTVRISNSARAQDAESARTIGGEREAIKLASTTSSQDGANTNGQQGRTAREWDRPDDPRREQAGRARDERERSQQDRQEQQERQRRQTLFTGNA